VSTDKDASVDAGEVGILNAPLGPAPEGIPTALRDREAWVCWHVGCRNCHTTVEYGVETCPECGEDTSKIPDDPTSGRYASSTDSATWTRFEAALAYHEREHTDTEGVGYVFTEDGPFVGVDLDNCRDPETGDLDPWAADAIERCASYAAVSSSGTGIHILAVGELPEGGNRSGNVEMYEDARYFALTGVHIDGTPEEPQSAQDAIDVYSLYGGLTRATGSLLRGDVDLLALGAAVQGRWCVGVRRPRFCRSHTRDPSVGVTLTPLPCCAG